MKALFWIQICGILYAYLGYPLVLRFLALISPHRGKSKTTRQDAQRLPFVTMIVPIYNEESVIARKLENSLALDYPRDKLEILFVSDGSTDRTAEIIRSCLAPHLKLLELPERGGKAQALNHGLRNAGGEVICFSDSSIMLNPDAVTTLMANFDDPAIGCASGEDSIDGGGGEGLYGRYELALRRLESKVHSIVGASGSFYAQRRSLCGEFPQGLAPDFLSVLNTVEQGYRAISDADAKGSMTSLSSNQAEFQRKVRTILRGISTLFAKSTLLNPLRFGLFAVELISHKLMRWCVPFFLLALLVSNLFLLDQWPYVVFLIGQILFYALALLGWLGVPLVEKSLAGRVAAYFTIVNVATLVAWWKYASGVRQEIWNPTRRESSES
jgi:glycosyltransferase involved in cell wall biosynthesis